MAGRPRTTLLVVLALALAGAAAALGLTTSTGIDTLVSSSNADYQATLAHDRVFGADPVVVLVREPLGRLLAPGALRTVSRLEACLAGQRLALSASRGALIPVAASAAKPYGGAGSPCGALMASRYAKVVYGPGTFLNRAVVAVGDQISSLTAAAAATVRRAEAAARKLARARGLDAAGVQAATQAAGKLALSQQLGKLGTLAQQVALTGAPSITDTAFLREIVFGSGSSGASRTAGASGSAGGSTRPNPRFAYLFPDAATALIQVRLRAGLSDTARTRAIGLIRAAVAMPQFRLPGGSYLVTGEPVVLGDLAGQVRSQVSLLLVGAAVVMGLVLLLVFRRRPRMLPLLVALAALAITLGLPAAAGMSLTIASIAVLPVLIGLGVDYGIQLQSGTSRRSLGAAALATAAGFLVLLLSPVPMVRGFGLLLAVGVVIALACALVVVPAVRSLIGPRVAPASATPDPRVDKHGVFRRYSTRNRITGALTASVYGALEILAGVVRPLRSLLAPGTRRTSDDRAQPGDRPQPGDPPQPGDRPRPGTRPRSAARPDRLDALLRPLIAHPRRVLAVAAALALAGWALDTQIPVQSDLTKLVPQSMPALQHLRALERATGVSGEIDVLVRADDVATPTAIRWMIGYENRVLGHFGYTSAGSCRTARLCPALSLPDLFQASGPALTATSIDSLLASVPPYFSSAVLTGDRHYASLAFGIRLMPLSEQRRVIGYLRAQLDPPAGVTASLSGVPVLAADADGSLSSSSRRLLTVLAALLAVGLALALVFRDPRRALIPLIPTLLAGGWSLLILYLIGIPLNPMSAMLGVLVIAVSTEFSVLLSERVRQERRAAAGGRPEGAARLLARGQLQRSVHRAYASTGAAVLASAVTAIAGFGILVLSNIAMLRQFGWVTVIDMAASLLGVLLVLPAVLALADRFSVSSPLPAARDVQGSVETDQ